MYHVSCYSMRCATFRGPGCVLAQSREHVWSESLPAAAFSDRGVALARDSPYSQPLSLFWSIYLPWMGFSWRHLYCSAIVSTIYWYLWGIMKINEFKQWPNKSKRLTILGECRFHSPDKQRSHANFTENRKGLILYNLSQKLFDLKERMHFFSTPSLDLKVKVVNKIPVFLSSLSFHLMMASCMW